MALEHNPPAIGASYPLAGLKCMPRDHKNTIFLTSHKQDNTQFYCPIPTQFYSLDFTSP